MAPARIAWALPPPGGVYRIARRPGPPFAPPDWSYADPDTGTFGNRFDDPSQRDGVPEAERFRSISASTSKVGAFGEVLAHLRPAPGVASDISRQTRDTGSPTIAALAGAIDPRDAAARLVSREWRKRRQVGRAVLEGALRFADLADAATLAHLRTDPDLARIAREHGLADIDLGAVTGRARPFTQACALHLHRLRDGLGEPVFAGIRYLSRLGAGPAWECWALFDDRIRFADPPKAQPVRANDPALLEVARLFHLTIEADDGALIRPWLE